VNGLLYCKGLRVSSARSLILSQKIITIITIFIPKSRNLDDDIQGSGVARGGFGGVQTPSIVKGRIIFTA